MDVLSRIALGRLQALEEHGESLGFAQLTRAAPVLARGDTGG